MPHRKIDASGVAVPVLSLKLYFCRNSDCGTQRVSVPADGPGVNSGPSAATVGSSPAVSPLSAVCCTIVPVFRSTIVR